MKPVYGWFGCPIKGETKRPKKLGRLVYVIRVIVCFLALIKAEVFPGIVVADIFHHLPQPLFIRRQFAIGHILTNKVAKDSSEVFMAGKGKETPAVRQHAHKATENPHVG